MTDIPIELPDNINTNRNIEYIWTPEHLMGDSDSDWKKVIGENGYGIICKGATLYSRPKNKNYSDYKKIVDNICIKLREFKKGDESF